LGSSRRRQNGGVRKGRMGERDRQWLDT
jgi:hypothetical protein